MERSIVGAAYLLFLILLVSVSSSWSWRSDVGPLQALDAAVKGTGSLSSITLKDDGTQFVEADYNQVCLTDVCDSRRTRCSCQIQKEENVYKIVANSLSCIPITDESEVEITVETVKEVKPVELVHEVQTDSQVPGSGEQFVAVRRGQGAWCAGCPIDISHDAKGVDKLIDMSLQHLDKYRPKTEHTLKTIVQLQKQVQLTGGVRFNLVLEVNRILCKDEEIREACENPETSVDTCYISILEKPWIKYADGTKYRAVTTNNCTEEYFFTENNVDDNIQDEIKKVQQSSVQAAPEELTPERIKNVEEQIIPKTESDIIQKVDVANVESKPNAPDASYLTTPSGLSDDKLEALDGLLNLFGFDDNQENDIPQKSATINESAQDSTKTNDSDDDRFLKTFSRKRRATPVDHQSLKLAELAVQTLDRHDKENVRRVVLDILSSKKVDKSSSIVDYEMKVVVGVLECLKSSMHPNECADFRLKEKKLCSMLMEVNTEQNSRKLIESGCSPYKSHDHELKHKSVKTRNAPKVGGYSPIDTQDAHVVSLTEQSLNKYMLTSSTQNKHKVTEIISASQQIVAGLNYKILFRIKETSCPKDSAGGNCELLESAPTLLCTAKVWERRWLNSTDINVKCEVEETPSRSKRSLIGALHDIDPRNSRIVNMAERSLEHYEKLFSNRYRHKLTNVLSAKRQVIAGHRTVIYFQIKETNCLKSTNKDISLCDVSDNAHPKVCYAEIVNQVGHDEKILVNCENPIDEDGKLDTNSVRLQYPLELIISKFDSFIVQFNKTYEKYTEEYQKRLQIFRENLNVVAELNDNEQGTAVYGINKFADLSREEFKQKYLGLDMSLAGRTKPLPKATIPKHLELPVSFDWRDKGAVTEVKDQGQCGSCWAFSVTGNIEGLYEIKNGKLLSFSEQELVDCDKLDEGCNGGLPSNAYQAIQDLGGLELENDYPYDAEDEKCHFNKSLSRVQLSGAVNVSSDEQEMAQYLIQNGPLSIGINANAMQFYMGGVSHPLKFLCSPSNLDHGVLIVGFGIHKYPIFKKTMPFWIVKNSWGHSWGESGYYRVYRGDGTCGLNQMVTSALL